MTQVDELTRNHRSSTDLEATGWQVPQQAERHYKEDREADRLATEPHKVFPKLYA